MDNSILFDQAQQKINNAKRILILFAPNVDPDCFSSAAALYFYLKTLKKTVFIAGYHGNVKTYLKYFPIPEKHLLAKKKLISKFDLFISVDGLSMDRLEVEKSIVSRNIVHFDHHLLTEEIIGLAICDSEKASTTELLYDFFKHIKFEIIPIIADALVLGLLDDTKNFQHGNADEDVFKKMAELVKISNRVYEFNRDFIYKKKIDDLKLLGLALSRIKFIKEHSLSLSVLKQEDLAKYKAEYKDMSLISYFLNTHKDSKFSLLLVERANGQLKASLRSDKEKGVNVAEIAKLFKGGGHLASAGFKLKGRVVEEPDGSWKIV